MTTELLITTTLDQIGKELVRAEHRLTRRRTRRRIAVVALAAPFALSGGSALAGIGPIASVLGTTTSPVPAPPPYQPGDKVWTTTPPDEAPSDIAPAAGTHSQTTSGDGQLPAPVRPYKPGDKVWTTTPPPS